MEHETVAERNCVIVPLTMDNDLYAATIRTYVYSELAPCAIKTFEAELQARTEMQPNVGGNILESAKEALWRAIINEMVLRRVAERLAQEKT